MIDRFTDRARKVILLAKREAQGAGDSELRPEHILLGLLTEGTGVGFHVLKELGVDVEDVCSKLRGPAGTTSTPAGKSTEELPYSHAAKRVMELSLDEARGFKQSYIGTEHFLLGLIREKESRGAKTLLDTGLTLDAVRKATLSFLGIQDGKAQETGLRFKDADQP